MKKIQAKIIILFILVLPALSFATESRGTGEFYQITVYHYTTTQQRDLIDQYLEHAYLPALHRQNIQNVGVFAPLANDTATDKRLYVLIPLRSLQQIVEFTDKLVKDAGYQEKGKAYLDAEYKTPPYVRLENILLKSFPLAPRMVLPNLSASKTERLYELRSYESATEKILINKVHMFNEGGEIDLFKRINANAVFYASVIAGSRMPNLMYITSYENRDDRDAHWKNFFESPEWKKLSAMPEYKNNVSKSDIIFMHATAYSDY